MEYSGGGSVFYLMNVTNEPLDEGLIVLLILLVDLFFDLYQSISAEVFFLCP